ARAGFEGIAFAIRDIKENMEMLTGKTPNRFNLLGGGTKSRLWSQIIADILQLPINIEPNSDAAYGAGLLACLAHTGNLPATFQDFSEITLEPDTSRATFYAEKYAEFNRLRQKFS
ncbi:MAG: FGGY-family carbohydrate kinase, partial [Pseudomonadota bacterium]|nr:FGGY-family carbohydrate kinase [Pseudomonadota bacterium]